MDFLQFSGSALPCLNCPLSSSLPQLASVLQPPEGPYQESETYEKNRTSHQSLVWGETHTAKVPLALPTLLLLGAVALEAQPEHSVHLLLLPLGLCTCASWYREPFLAP
jgi:hypothetical protein